MKLYYFVFIINFFSICLFSKPLEVEVKAKQAILFNPDNNAILYDKHAKEKAYPASITKIATALFVIDKKKEHLDQWVTVSKESLHMISPETKISNNFTTPPYWLESDGSKYGLIAGEVISFRSLLYGLMLVSGNDCANVIADECSGSISGFIKELNQYLLSINCKQTNFLNPHGLHNPGHYTTPYDMAIMTKKALSFPYFQQIVSTLSYTTARTNKSNSKEIIQSNRLMKEGKYYYPLAIGVKTGFHSNAGYNLVAAAKNKNRTLIAVLLGGEKSDYRYSDAISLFDAAFAEIKERKIIFDMSKKFLATIEGAKSSLKGYIKTDLQYEYFPSEEQQFKVYIKWDDFKLPISKDAQVGEINIINPEGCVLSTVPLYAEEKVRRTFSKYMQDLFKKVF